jgi:hypothetical protein
LTGPAELSALPRAGEATDRYFATGKGHDGQAASMLHFLKWGTTDIAEILRAEGYGPEPGDKKLRDEATAAGWKSRGGQ